MFSLRFLALVLPAMLMLSLVAWPPALANKFVRHFRFYVTLASGAQALLAMAAAIAYAAGWMPGFELHLGETQGNSPLFLTFLFDGLSGLMLALVSFVGWVICNYSIRYLDGQANQGRYYRWTAFTIGAVSLMVVSGNLLLFFVAWLMTSLGLHQLLMHFDQRPGARRAAWTKFTVSRVGDIALLGAMAIIFANFQTLQFSTLFASIEMNETANPSAMQVASLLLIVGAITKSVQFPFHIWLPQTMETPTPVSALMHAGIVNGGGFLILRMSPLVSQYPWTLTVLAAFGLVTACFASIVMLTQTNIKATLAYSTIAQMGFMMLQCGLGAFSAAMLHILAHSLYKAHAFLGSASVLEDRAATRSASRPLSSDRIPWSQLAISATLIIAFLTISMFAFGIDPRLKPGGLLLGGILCLALTSWISQVLQTGSAALLARSLAACGGLCLLYVVSFVAVDKMVAASLPAGANPATMWVLAGLVIVAFSGLFALQVSRTRSQYAAFLSALHVHASNGFYVDAWMRRTFGHLATK